MPQNHQHLPLQRGPQAQVAQGFGRGNNGSGANGHGNAFRQDQLRQAQGNDKGPGKGGAAAQQLGGAKPKTEKEKFEEAFTAKKDEKVDATVSRWAELTGDEQTAYTGWLEAKKKDPNTPLPESLKGRVTPGAEQGQSGYVQKAGDKYFQYGVQKEDPEKPTKRGDLIGPDAKQFYSRAFVEKNKKKDDKGVEQDLNQVRMLKPDGTVGLIDENKSGMAELPTEGTGFRTHNRNDVSINGKAQPDQFGKPEAVARTMNVMSDYNTLFPNSSLSIGDMSDDKGGSPLLFDNNNSKRHGSHYKGSQVDLQYPNGTGSTNVDPTQGDDLFRLRSLMRLGEGRGMNNYYAGNDLDGKLFPQTGTSVGYNSEHDNHLHMGAGNGKNQ